MRHGLQQLVSAVMAERVVDQLEVIEIDQRDCDDAFAALRAQHHLAQAVVHQQAVGQAGNRIVIGQVLELFLVELGLGDVLDGAFVKQQIARFVLHRAGIFRNPDIVAVLAPDLGHEIGDDAAFPHQPHEFGAPRRVGINLVLDITDAGDELGTAGEPVDGGERGIDVQIAAIGRSLENALGGVLEYAAKAALSLLQRLRG